MVERHPVRDIRYEPNVGVDEWRFERRWVWVMLSILAWVAFWRIADEHAGNAYAQTLCWFVVLVALWIVANV
jgi:hypothetical protein